jgi:hypothetical protein
MIGFFVWIFVLALMGFARVCAISENAVMGKRTYLDKKEENL